jgi:hypothetical protein
MGPKTQELSLILAEMIALLDKEGETHWSGWMGQAKTRLEGLDYSGVEHLLRAYGGMGSFNDLIISPEYNDRLKALRTQAWELAEEIKREHVVNSES